MVRWLAFALWYAAIIFTSSLTSTPESGQPVRDVVIAKSGHVVAYAILGWLLAVALTTPAAGLAVRARLALMLVIISGVVLAALDETRQSFVYGRKGQPLDVLLDTVALSGGALLHHWLWRRRRVHSTPAPHAEHAQRTGE